MKKIFNWFLCFLFFCLFTFLSACKYESDKSDEIQPTPRIDSAVNSVISDIITPEITMMPTESKESVPSDTIVQELSNDIDNNGVIDSVQIFERNNGTTFIKVKFNGDYVFQHEWTDLRIMSIEAFEYLDLDRDEEKEIFITAWPNVNSRPLIEVLTLKQFNSGWYMMDIPLNENGHNYFPFHITRGKEEFDFIISSEYTDQTIHFDASAFYVDDPKNNFNSIQAFRNNHYKEGDMVASVSAWGIWDAHTGSYDGRNCIIAEQGMEAPYGNGLGRIFIYYDYDEFGLIEILNIEYVSI